MGTVAAQSCGVQVGSATTTTQSPNIQLIVPVSMTCTNASNPLWAVGTAYDTSTNANLDTNTVTMSSNNGYYSGQLVFTVPSSVAGHQVQVQVQVYNSYINGQYAGLVAATSPTLTVNASYPAAYTYGSYASSCYYGYYYSNGIPYYGWYGYYYSNGQLSYYSCGSSYYAYPYPAYYHYYYYP